MHSCNASMPVVCAERSFHISHQLMRCRRLSPPCRPWTSTVPSGRCLLRLPCRSNKDLAGPRKSARPFLFAMHSIGCGAPIRMILRPGGLKLRGPSLRYNGTRQRPSSSPLMLGEVDAPQVRRVRGYGRSGEATPLTRTSGPTSPHERGKGRAGAV